MPAYLIADEDIQDPEAFDEYKRLVLPVIEAFGGRFLSRGAEVEIIEAGDWTPGRMVIIEFPDLDQLRAWYDSPEFAPIRSIRRAAVRSTLVALGPGSA
jgi:uncharacterized protein (DUF1330 family)